MRSPLPHAAPAAALALAMAACAPSTNGPRVDVPTPERVDLPALEARLEPADGQRGVLLHFWATW